MSEVDPNVNPKIERLIQQAAVASIVGFLTNLKKPRRNHRRC